MEKQESFNKFKRFYQDNKRMPSYAELADLLGYKSRNSAYKLIKHFIANGFIAKDTAGKIIPSNLFYSTKVLGTVEAGFPSPAEEELSDTMNLDEYLIGNKEATYMLKVRGDSMIGAGIMEGDMVLVERRSNAKEGEIVLAEVDGQWTMKYLRKKGGKAFLEAANERYKPIVAKETLNIAAVVIAVIRKY
ncbi:repressor LexA [Patescibacteria group bacterium]|nr:MAG: repressor LexA [Patescibacteria group bacterium]